MNIVNTKLNANINTKICLIADIHFSNKFKTEIFQEIVDNIKTNNPDYICIVGDIIDYTEIENSDNIDLLYNFIKDLSKIAKVIITLGNHDVTMLEKNKGKTPFKHKYKYPDALVKNIKAIKNATLLSNEVYEEKNIRFIGYEESYEAYYDEKNGYKIALDEINKLISDIDDKKYNVLLSHNPLNFTLNDMYKDIKNFQKINIILSGHTHNGMLPNFMKTNHLLISPRKKWFTKDGRGHIIKDGVDIIVTGGITKLSERANVFSNFNLVYNANIDYIVITQDKNM